MKELEEGVFDLGWQEPFNISADKVQELLRVYRDGLQQRIMSLIFGYSVRYNVWVGVSHAKILSTIASFDGTRLGIKPEEKAKIYTLALKTAKNMKTEMDEMIKTKALRKIENEKYNGIYCPVVKFN